MRPRVSSRTLTPVVLLVLQFVITINDAYSKDVKAAAERAGAAASSRQSSSPSSSTAAPLSAYSGRVKRVSSALKAAQAAIEASNAAAAAAAAAVARQAAVSAAVVDGGDRATPGRSRAASAAVAVDAPPVAALPGTSATAAAAPVAASSLPSSTPARPRGSARSDRETVLQRADAAAGVAGGGSSAQVERERVEHKRMEDELLKLTASLKAGSLRIEQQLKHDNSVRRALTLLSCVRVCACVFATTITCMFVCRARRAWCTAQLLDNTATQVESNVDKISSARVDLEARTNASVSSFCSTLLMLVVVVILTVFTFVLIQARSKGAPPPPPPASA